MGDLVLARDDETGETGYRPVVRTYETPGLEVFDLVVAEACGVTETVTVTYEHPFWVADTGWIPAGQLVPGDHVVTADGADATVLDRGVEARATTVHNVEVDGLHTYFVGDLGVWVHNTSRDCDADESGASTQPGIAGGAPPSRSLKRRNVTRRHKSKKKARDAAQKNRRNWTPKKDAPAAKKRRFKEQHKYKKPERHADTKHPDPHFHDSNKSASPVNVHHEYPE